MAIQLAMLDLQHAAFTRGRRVQDGDAGQGPTLSALDGCAPDAAVVEIIPTTVVALTSNGDIGSSNRTLGPRQGNSE